MQDIDNHPLDKAIEFLRDRGLGDDDLETARKLLAEMPSAAEDATESISDNVVERLLAFLRKGLEPELYEKIKAALNAHSESAVESPPTTLAGDSFFHQRFPEASRITPDPTPVRRKPAAGSSPDYPDYAGFAARFPEASDIKAAW